MESGVVADYFESGPTKDNFSAEDYKCVFVFSHNMHNRYKLAEKRNFTEIKTETSLCQTTHCHVAAVKI